MMTDPNPLQTSPWRSSVSESDLDPMITTSPGGNPRRFISTGRQETQQNLFGLVSYTIGSRHSQLRRLSLGSGATDITRRFEEMKLGINEWKMSAESQLISVKIMNERAEVLSKMSLELANDAMESGMNITVCKLIADYEIYITTIREQITKRFEYLNNPIFPNSYCNGQVLDSYRLESDHHTNDNLGLDNLHYDEIDYGTDRLEADDHEELDLELESDIYNTEDVLDLITLYLLLMLINLCCFRS